MAGVDDGVVGKGEQPLADGDDDLVEVRVLPAVAPGPPSNRVSPVKTTPSVTKHVAPGVCPGVVTARSVALAMVNSSPSPSGWNASCGWVSRHRNSSAGLR